MRDRLLGGGDGRRQDDLDVVVAFGSLHGGIGRLADHRQDRALHGLGDRAVCSLGAERHGVGQVQAVEPALAAEALGHPAEDLARDDARVAARTHQRPEADRRSDPLGRPVRGPFGFVEGRLDRCVHVSTGVTVGDRIDIEGVDLVDVRLHVGDCRTERSQETLAVARAARHQARAASDVCRPGSSSTPPRDAVGPKRSGHCPNVDSPPKTADARLEW